MNNFFANLKIKYKFLIILGSVFFIILSISGFFIYNNIKQQIGTQIENELVRSINSITKITETLSKDVGRTKLKQVALKNKKVLLYYYSLFEKGELGKEEILKELKEVFSKQTIGKSGYLAAIYNDKEQKKLFPLIHPFLPQTKDLSQNEIIQKAVQTKDGYNEYMWKNPNEGFYRKKAMYTMSFEPWNITIVATAYLSELHKVIDIRDISEDIKTFTLGSTGYIYILNSQADAIYNSSLNNKNKVLVTQKELASISDTIINRKNGKMYYDWQSSNTDKIRKKIIVFRYLPDLDWYISASAYLEEFNSPLIKLRNTFLISFVVLMFFTILAILWVASYITKPLNDIIVKLKLAKQSDFKEKIEIQRNDELGELVKQYNMFVDKLDMSSSQLYVTVNKFKAILNNATAIIYIKNIEGEYELINKQFVKMFNLFEEDVLGKKDVDIFEENTAKKLRDNDLEVIANANSMSIEENVYHNNKTYFFISIKFPLFDEMNNITSICGISTDITVIKEAETEIMNLNKNLEYEITRRTSDLLVSNLELEKTIIDLKSTQTQLIQSEKMASLGDLVAGIAHEINTPVGLGVTGITHLEYLTQQLFTLYESDDLSQDEFETYFKNNKELVSSIHTNLNRAADLIKSFKQVAVDQSSEAMRNFNIKLYLTEILVSLRHETRRTKHQFIVTCPDDIVITSYPGAFSQVITNLVLNSIIHGFKNIDSGRVTIMVKKEDNNVILIYKDNGNGIKKENLSKIFDPFFTTNRNHGGSGLGLNIIYNIVTATLNGEISCKSKPCEGVEFTMTIPLD